MLFGPFDDRWNRDLQAILIPEPVPDIAIVLGPERNSGGFDQAFLHPEFLTDSETLKLDGIMPVVKIGIEGTVAGQLVLFGEIKQGIGKPTFDRPSAHSSSSTEAPVGGVEIKAGFRMYF